MHFAAKLGVWKVIESKTKNVRNFRKISYRVFFNNFGTVKCAVMCSITAQNSESEAELRLKLQLIKDHRVSRDTTRIFVISDVRTSKLSEFLSVCFPCKMQYLMSSLFIRAPVFPKYISSYHEIFEYKFVIADDHHVKILGRFIGTPLK